MSGGDGGGGNNDNKTAASTTTAGTGAQGLLPTKSQKGRRKISLPWFRQNSTSNPRAALSRQHTIDSPGSFRLFRQSSNNYKVNIKRKL